MMHRDHDDALSELIGFVLLLGILTVALSLYITYAVPAQGRENEIAHMNYIGQQMVGVKGDIDSLWVNNRQNVPIYRSINLGTQSGLTQGGLSGLPLLNPVGSGGTLGINEKKDNLIIDFIRSSSASPITQSDYILYPGMPCWVTVNYLPGPPITITDSNNVLSVTLFQNETLSISTVKNNSSILSNATVINHPELGSQYAVNILDGAYGLNSGLNYPFYLTLPSGTNAAFMIPQSYTLEGPEVSFPVNHPMGSLDYRSKNNYWIYQNYFYQNGGVFLKQDDGMVIQLSPEISVQKKVGYTLVSITDLEILPKGSSDTTQLGGTGSVQVRESVGAPSHTLVTNLQSVTISVSGTADAQTADMWRTVFLEADPENSASSGPVLTVSRAPVILDYIHVPVDIDLLINRAV